MEANAEQTMQALLEQIDNLIAEENGWEPKTARDYRVLTWAYVKDVREDIKELKKLAGRISRLEWAAMGIGGSLIALATRVIVGG